ncbi:MAG: hypothetical protein WKH97_17810 [Casimicrobiaceae bacterium]
MITRDTPPVPTARQLGKATSIAVLAASVILLTAVLPAEYGFDPTGAGKLLGLTAMSSSGKKEQDAVLAAAAAANQSQAANTGEVDVTATLTQSELPLRLEEMSLVLPPGKGAEIKASMEKGGRFIYSWVSEGGKVEFDMHGEPRNAKGNEFTSFSKALQSSDQGAFTAPFAGTHGWYWENCGKVPVTIRVKVSGFYEKLYKP